jgi:hypothetical protein
VRFLSGVLILTFALAGLSACTEKAPPVTVHDQDARPKPADPQPVDPEQTPWEASAESQSRFDTSADPLKEVMLPLAEKVFQRSRITDARARQDEKSRGDLVSLNAMMLRLPADQYGRAEFKKILDWYIATLSFECGQILSSCRGFTYLDMAGNSSQVIKLAAPHRRRACCCSRSSCAIVNPTWSSCSS